MSAVDQPAPFNLLRWFAWLSPLLIALIALANAWLITSFLNNHLFQREAAITQDFVRNILLSDGSLGYLSNPDDAVLRARFQNSIDHLTNMSDVLRANVYGQNRRILWSSDARIVGKHFTDNDELESAMRGELVVHAGRITRDSRQKKEHEGLDPSVEFFVESYIPLIAPSTSDIVGVVEIYKAPLALTAAIREGRMQVGLAALASALALYVSLFWLVRRADRTIKQQHGKLMEAETLAVIGELTASVAHNIRNPLSSIRSSAELSLEMPHEDCSEQAREIIRGVDRISARITELLRLSEKEKHTLERFDLAQLLQRTVADLTPAFAERGQTVSFANTTHRPWVSADPALLQQVFLSLLGNATEAMSVGGICRVALADEAKGMLQVAITDTGVGIGPEVIGNVFRPFFTTKPRGLGLGLPFAKRIVERFGGSIRIMRRLDGPGTNVSILLPQA